MSEVEVARFFWKAVKRKRYIVQSRFTYPNVSSWFYDSSHSSKGKAIREAKRIAERQDMDTRVLDTED